jgi:hypothetical protein
MQQRNIMETVSGALTNAKLDIKIEDLVIKVHWASPVTRYDSLAVYLIPQDPPQNPMSKPIRSLFIKLTRSMQNTARRLH